MKHRKKRIPPRIISLALAVACVAIFVGTADAARLTVTVARQGGGGNEGNPPFAGATACFVNDKGTRFETKTTDSQGRAVFDNVPEGRIKVSSSASGFVAQSREIDMTSVDRAEQFVLQQGNSAPVCLFTAPITPRQESAEQSVGPPRLAFFRINDGAATTNTEQVTLNFNMEASAIRGVATPIPTHFRAAALPYQQILGAEWIPVPRNSYDFARGQYSVPFTIAAPSNSSTKYGARTLGFQVKVEGSQSNVRNDAIEIVPVQLREYRLSGNELSEMLAFSFNRNFNVSTSVEATNNHCPDAVFDRAQLRINCALGLLKDRVWNKVATLTFFTGSRSLTAFWRVKQVVIDESPHFEADSQSVSGEEQGDSFRVRIEMRTSPAAIDTCLLGFFTLQTIVLEGPADDIFREPNKPWKSAFPSFGETPQGG